MAPTAQGDVRVRELSLAASTEAAVIATLRRELRELHQAQTAPKSGGGALDALDDVLDGTDASAAEIGRLEALLHTAEQRRGGAEGARRRAEEGARAAEETAAQLVRSLREQIAAQSADLGLLNAQISASNALLKDDVTRQHERGIAAAEASAARLETIASAAEEEAAQLRSHNSTLRAAATEAEARAQQMRQQLSRAEGKLEERHVSADIVLQEAQTTLRSLLERSAAGVLGLGIVPRDEAEAEKEEEEEGEEEPTLYADPHNLAGAIGRSGRDEAPHRHHMSPSGNVLQTHHSERRLTSSSSSSSRPAVAAAAEVSAAEEAREELCFLQVSADRLLDRTAVHCHVSHAPS